MIVAYFDREGHERYGEFDTVWELRNQMDWDGIDKIYAAEAHYPEPYISADLVIDNIRDDFECNHDMYFLDNVSDKDYAKLEKMLNEVVEKWVEDCGYKPSGVELDEELHTVLV